MYVHKGCKNTCMFLLPLTQQFPCCCVPPILPISEGWAKLSSSVFCTAKSSAKFIAKAWILRHNLQIKLGRGHSRAIIKTLGMLFPMSDFEQNNFPIWILLREQWCANTTGVWRADRWRCKHQWQGSRESKIASLLEIPSCYKLQHWLTSVMKSDESVYQYAHIQ